MGDRMRAFQRRNDALQAAEGLKSGQRLLIGDEGVAGALLIAQPGMFWSYGRIVQSRGDRVRQGNLIGGIELAVAED